MAEWLCCMNFGPLAVEKYQSSAYLSESVVLPKLGWLMGDDNKTSRSTGSNYWAALRWLSGNQNKQPDNRPETVSWPINNPAKIL